MAEQFRDLQSKRKERFKARVTNHAGKLHSLSSRPSIDSATSSVDSAATMPSDDLGLMTATQERANSKLTQGRAADHGALQQTVEDLLRKVGRLQSEKADLSSRLRNADKQVSALLKTMQEERAILGEGVGGTVTTQKIVELSRKNRVLHAELTAERNRSRQIEKQLQLKAAEQVCNTQEIGRQNEACVTEDEKNNLESQLNALQEQLSQSKHKTADYRNQCQLLKQELKLAHRVITKEVGPGVTVSELLNSPSGWRGRSQQIIMLQNKLLELKNSTEKTSGSATNMRLAAGHAQSRRERVEARQKAALEKMNRERRRNLETTRQELEMAQTECARLHKECSALRARNKILTENIKTLKSVGGPSTLHSAPSGGNRSHTSRSTALESRMCELEQANQQLQQQLQDCQKRLQKSRQTHSRPSTKTEVLSLPSIPSSQQSKTKQLSVRNTLSANNNSVMVKNETAALREAQVLLHIAESERDKLLNLTMTLQHRLDNSTDQLVRLKMEKSCGSRNPPNLCGRTNNAIPKQKLQSDAAVGERVEALEVELAIQRDENAVLRDTLTQLRQEKLEDAKVFRDMLQNTKWMCVEMMRGQMD